MEHAAVQLHNYILHHLDLSKTVVHLSKSVVYLSIYLKFFYAIDHKLLKKLNYYGMYATACKLLESYLTNRNQFVLFEDTKYNITKMHMGVPQSLI